MQGTLTTSRSTFYQYANAFVKQGGTFSWATDLGSGFVNSYSFYLFGQPVFLAVAGGACAAYAMGDGAAALPENGGGRRRCLPLGAPLGAEEGWSMLAGFLYAFSGFSIYNIFFNHFLDVVALFPYLLAALDDAAIDGKKGRFPFWVALNLLNNYFFFAGQAVFLIIYFFCMVAGRRYRIGLRRFAALRGRQRSAARAAVCCCCPPGFRFCRTRAPSTRLPGTATCSTANPSSTALFFTAPF